MAQKEINVVVAGHICLDMFPELVDTERALFEELLVPGKLTNVGGLKISTGGSVSNTGIAMQVLGANTSLIAKVGDDFIGKAILDFLRNKSSVKGIKIVEGEFSSYTIVIAPKNIDRMFLHNPGTNDTFGYDDIDFDLVRNSRLFHLGYPPLMKRLYQDDGEQLQKIFRKVKEFGVITSLDFALPDPSSPSGKVNWNTILKKVLPYVDIFLPSVEEAQFMLDKEKFLEMRERADRKELLHSFSTEDLTQLSNKLLDYGGKIVGLKCGSKGFYIKTASREKLNNISGIDPDNWSERQLWEPTYHVENFASAAGSGDCAIAGFLVALLKGETVEQCLRYACMCGAQNVQALDAIDGIRNWEETTRKIRGDWKKNVLEINAPGWEFDLHEKLWHGPEDKKSS